MQAANGKSFAAEGRAWRGMLLGACTQVEYLCLSLIGYKLRLIDLHRITPTCLGAFKYQQTTLLLASNFPVNGMEECCVEDNYEGMEVDARLLRLWLLLLLLILGSGCSAPASVMGGSGSTLGPHLCCRSGDSRPVIARLLGQKLHGHMYPSVSHLHEGHSHLILIQATTSIMLKGLIGGCNP